MPEILGTVHTHTHTPCNLINKNTQFICAFNNNANINVGAKSVRTRLTTTACLQ